MKQYLFPAALGAFILIFFLGLPDLKTASVGKLQDSVRHPIDRIDIAVMLAICLIAGAVSFHNLGNSSSPETFTDFSSKTEYISFNSAQSVGEIWLFTGVGTGQYVIEYSEDGESFSPAAVYDQGSADVLKWQRIVPETRFSAVKLRVSGSGNQWLGEFAAFDEIGNQIACSSESPNLTDEQALVPEAQNFMNSSYFDEIYHARTAWEHLNNVYPYEISHPPLGKLIISIGVTLFGMTPFGWRFSGTLFGILMLPVMYIFIKKMFGSRLASICGTIVFASDFMRFVQTRIATIDTYAVFFILLMYLFMYGFVSSGSKMQLALSGIFFGIGAACKWTCIYAGAGLAVLWAAYWIINRSAGFKSFVKNALFCIPFFIIIPCFIYYLSYIPYGKAMGIRGIFNSDYLRAVLSNQEYMFSYHSKLVAEHPYSSVWYQWMLDIRPILYYLEYFDDGSRSSFGAFLNPALCWGGLLALFALIYRAVFTKDKIAGFIVIGYMAQLLPWMFITRLTFEYHYFPCSVFLVLALAYVFSMMENSVRRYKAYIISFTGVSCALFALFYPALSGARISSTIGTQFLRWLPTWPF